MKIKHYYGHSFCVEQKGDRLIGKVEVIFLPKRKILRAAITCKPDSVFEYDRGVRLLCNELSQRSVRWLRLQHQKACKKLTLMEKDLQYSYSLLYSHIKKP